MSDSKPRKTLVERLDELTGYDEAHIEDQFGWDIYDQWDALMEAAAEDRMKRKANTRILRGVLFADKLHQGIPPKVAFEAVMSVSLAEVNVELGYDNDDDEPADTEPPADGATPASTPEGKGVSDAA